MARKKVTELDKKFPQRPRGRRNWLAKIIDPEGMDPKTGCVSPRRQKQLRKAAARRFVRVKIQKGERHRKIKQVERLEWVSDKIRLGWSHRKIQLEFAKAFNLSTHRAEVYIEKTYSDFRGHFADSNKRTVLMAEHCSCLKEAASRAVEAQDFVAANALLRQYAEVVGVLVPLSMIKFQTEDNRQQIIIGAEEMKATLSALENLSEQDLFHRAYDARSLEGHVQKGPGALPVLDAQTAVGVPDREA